MKLSEFQPSKLNIPEEKKWWLLEKLIEEMRLTLKSANSIRFSIFLVVLAYILLDNEAIISMRIGPFDLEMTTFGFITLPVLLTYLLIRASILSDKSKLLRDTIIDLKRELFFSGQKWSRKTALDMTILSIAMGSSQSSSMTGTHLMLMDKGGQYKIMHAFKKIVAFILLVLSVAFILYSAYGFYIRTNHSKASMILFAFGYGVLIIAFFWGLIVQIQRGFHIARKESEDKPK